VWADPKIFESITSSNAIDTTATNGPNVPQIDSEIATQQTQAQLGARVPDLCHTIPAPVLTLTAVADAPAVAPAHAPSHAPAHAPAVAPALALANAPILLTSGPELPPQAPPLLAAPSTPQIPHPSQHSAFQQAPFSLDLSSTAPAPGTSHHVPTAGVSGMATSHPPFVPLTSTPATFDLLGIYSSACSSPAINLSHTNTSSVIFQAPGSGAATHNSVLVQPTSFSFLQPPSFSSSGHSHTNKSRQPTDENAPPHNHGFAGRGKKNDEGATSHTPPQDLEKGTRRSRRAPVPSTRLDKLNEIGTNIVPPKPPANTLSTIEEPLWFAPAYDYLKQSALGDPWIHLVERWAQHERAKGWKSGKVRTYSFSLLI
jgi:hypothetical protein